MLSYYICLEAISPLLTWQIISLIYRSCSTTMTVSTKMEGALCQWSLAIQEYDFKFFYCKDSSHSNADALFWCSTELCAIAIGLPHYSSVELHASQSNDNMLSVVLCAYLNCRYSTGHKMEQTAILQIQANLTPA